MGPYRLEERLGHGGMGTVHRATDAAGRSVAVKVLHPHIAFDTAARTRLEREVATLARVRHPRVASFLDADVEAPTPYIVTEFVDGLPLDEHVATHGPLDDGALRRFTAGVHEALRAIHEVGVVHRDLKPGNVMVDRAGEPVIIDFGIAHIGDESRLTATGLVMGTPGYLAPELVEGGHPTVATDWWGLGAVLAFASMGRNPYGGGPNEAILARIRRGEHDLRSMDGAWRPLAEACLAVDPSARPTAAEVREVVENGGGALPVRRETQPLGVQTGPPGEDPGATQPVGHDPAATRAVPGAGAWASPAHAPADATRPVERTPTREIPRSAVSRRDESVLQPPPQHRAQPAGTLREPEPRAWAPPGPAQQTGQPFSTLREPEPRPWPQAEQPVWPDARPVQPAPQAGHGASVLPQGAPGPARLHPYDPRGRQRRLPWVVLTGALLVIALAMLWPVVATAVVAAWVLVARWVDHSAMGHLRRLMARGRRRGDAWRITAAAPWHLVTAVLRSAASLIAPAVLGAAVVVLVNLFLGHDALTSFRTPSAVGLDNALAWGSGAFVAVLALWWGIDSASLRRGTHLTLAAPLRSGPAAAVGALVLVVAGAVVALWGLSQGWPTSLVPLG